MNTDNANRTYQDTVFRRLFSTKEKLIELYNALENTNYGPDTPVEITTLEDVFYIDRKNDLGFILADRFIVLAEHQATIAPNIPLRQLGYIGRTFERFLKDIQIYGTRLQKIPAPEFYVLYTGDTPWNKDNLRLSDSFSAPPPENSMELVVKVIDLSYNEDNEILKRSSTLEGYSRLLYYIKTQVKDGIALGEAIKVSILRCQEEGCLAEFLRENDREVQSMLFQEITWEEFAELRAKEAAEDSFEEGLKQGVQLGGIRTLIQDNLEEKVSHERIIEKLMKRFSLVREDAEKYLNQELEKTDE